MSKRYYVVIDELYEVSQDEDNFVLKRDWLFAITVEKHITVAAISFSIHRYEKKEVKLANGIQSVIVERNYVLIS